MRSSALTGVLVAQLLAGAAVAQAQALGDVARQEEARRKTVKAPSKVYTNGSLPGSDAAPAPQTPSSAVPQPNGSGAATPAPAQAATPPAAAAGTPGAAATPGAAGPATADAPRDEKYWRGRIDTSRTALARAQTFEEALQTRINALSADFVNRDDPAQRNVIAADRQKALAELERVRKEIVDHQKAIVATQEEARKAGAPAGWVR
jgi:hypothetical protein